MIAMQIRMLPPPAIHRLAAVSAMLCLLGGTRTTTAAERTLAAARESIRSADASRHVTALADDSFEGREGGSRGGHAAGTYIVGAIEALGLQPAGDNGSYYQRFGSMRNILALQPGSDPTVAHELIVVGAH